MSVRFAGSHRATAVGTRYAVVTGHPIATSTAISILANGATPADAAIAASAVLAVVSPQATSIGGDGCALHRDRSGHVSAFDGAGVAFGKEPELMAGEPAMKGAVSIVVPGLVDLWRLLHERLGRTPAGTLLLPAVRLAEDGYPLGRELELYLGDSKGAVPPQARELITGDPAASGLFRNRGLSRIISEIAERGFRAFYEGMIAAKLDAWMRSRGREGFADGLSGYFAREVQPVRDELAGWSIDTMPPPFTGILTLKILRELQAAGLFSSVLGREWEAANIARDVIRQLSENIYDIRFAGASADRTAAHIDQILNALIDGEGRPQDTGSDTCGILIVADDGEAISMMQSIFQPFGSGEADRESGILFNNRMGCFSNTVNNRPAPGKRPLHTLNPIIADDNVGGGTFALCSPGGISQITTCVQLLRALVSGDLAVDEIIDRNRWSVDRNSDLLAEGDVTVMPGFSRFVPKGGSFYMGSAKIAGNVQGRLFGVGDLRREASAAAF